MKTNEEYIDDYLDAYNEAKKANRLSENGISMEEYLNKIHELRNYQGVNEFDTERHQGAMISQMLWSLNPLTPEELKEKTETLHKNSKINDKNMLPRVLEELEKMTLPLIPRHIRYITTALFREQITEEMIPKNVLEDYKKSVSYQNYLATKKRKDK